MQLYIIDQMLDASQALLRGLHCHAPHNAVYFVALFEQKFGEVGAVLAGDPVIKAFLDILCFCMPISNQLLAITTLWHCDTIASLTSPQRIGELF
jgi:hypothetical protein